VQNDLKLPEDELGAEIRKNFEEAEDGKELLLTVQVCSFVLNVVLFVCSICDRLLSMRRLSSPGNGVRLEKMRLRCCLTRLFSQQTNKFFFFS
jgi:pantothenate kinase type III